MNGYGVEDHDINRFLEYSRLDMRSDETRNLTLVTFYVVYSDGSERLIRSIRCVNGKVYNEVVEFYKQATNDEQAASLIAQRLIPPVYDTCREATLRTKKTYSAGIPRLWELFPLILPRTVKERVYEPIHEELKEDYLAARKRWRTPWAKRYVTFCFTVKTIGLVCQSLWAAFGEKTRRALIVLAVGLISGSNAKAIREKLAEILGRLP